MKRLALVFLLIFLPSVAMANVGPYGRRTNPPPGFHVVPIQSEDVEVVSETLTFDLNEDATHAQVTADYQMQNNGDSQVLSLAFPFSNGPYIVRSIEETTEFIQVEFDLVEVDWELKVLPDIYVANWGYLDGLIYSIDQDGRAEVATFETILVRLDQAVHPKDLEGIWHYNYDEKFLKYEGDDLTHGNSLFVLLFDIQIEAGQQHNLKVSYRQYSGFDDTRTALPTRNYYYFFDPASYWQDFKDLTIKINLPPGYRLRSANMDFVASGQTLMAQSDTLPPNLMFSIHRKFPASVFNRTAWSRLLGYLGMMLPLWIFVIPVLVVAWLGWKLWVN